MQFSRPDAVVDLLVDALDDACEKKRVLTLQRDFAREGRSQLSGQVHDLRHRIAELERDLYVAGTNRDVARKERDELRYENHVIRVILSNYR